MNFYYRQAAAVDNNRRLSTQPQHVTGELGINTSHSEAKKKGLVVTQRVIWICKSSVIYSYVWHPSVSYWAMQLHFKQLTSAPLRHHTERALCSGRTCTKVTFKFTFTLHEYFPVLKGRYHLSKGWWKSVFWALVAQIIFTRANPPSYPLNWIFHRLLLAQQH